MELDKLSSLEAAALMNRMDEEVAATVNKALPTIAAVIDRIVKRYKRLDYEG